MKKHALFVLSLLCLALFPLSAPLQAENTKPHTKPQDAEIPPALSAKALGNFNYACGLDDMSFPMRNGLYKREAPYLEGRSMTISANLTQAAWGNIPGAGDSGQVAAVVYVYNTGGTGYFYQLSLLGLCGGRACELACAPLGDRVQLQNIEMQNGAIEVSLVTHAENDPACCPSKHETQTWVYEQQNEIPGELVQK